HHFYALVFDLLLDLAAPDLRQLLLGDQLLLEDLAVLGVLSNPLDLFTDLLDAVQLALRELGDLPPLFGGGVFGCFLAALRLAAPGVLACVFAHFPPPELAGAKLVSDVQDLRHRQPASEQGPQDLLLALLDALGNLHLTLASEERNGAHFAQVETDRVVGLAS